MLKTEIILLANNQIIPFQNLKKNYGLNFIELNKLFATQSLAEHGLGFLINIYKTKNQGENQDRELLCKIIFDTGSINLTFLHNLKIRSYNLLNTNFIVLSHWHYDHTGGLYEILEGIEKEVPVICHNYANFKRFFRRANDVKFNDLLNKKEQDIQELLNSSKIVAQEPIDKKRIKDLNGELIFSKDSFNLLNSDVLRITVSGEIPKRHKIENFRSFCFLYNDIIENDEILDDKCLIFEYENNVVLLTGCCHSGIMNTIDYVKTITDKPISHIIGGFHMANASNSRIKETIDFLTRFQKYELPLYLFPIHCSGEKFLYKLKLEDNPNLKAFNPSVGTTFNF
ncbi:MAG: MBL fold metallo-hydrolase [Promethearchaeota archaeon]